MTPSLFDHGVPQHNVLKRVSEEDFAAFHKLVCGAAVTAREALDATTVASSAKKWRELFGNKFPDGGEDDDGGDNGGGGGDGRFHPADGADGGDGKAVRVNREPSARLRQGRRDLEGNPDVNRPIS